MSGATTIFRMPASFAKDNYPIVRDGSAPSGRPVEGHRAAGSGNGTTTASSGNEHQVTTEFKSLLGGGGGRRTATA